MKSFIGFVREQGVVGLAVGFILGGAVKEVVSSLVNDVINPLLGVVLGASKSWVNASLTVGSAKVMYGHFLTVLIDFIIVALVVFYIVKGLGLDKLDSKKKK